MSIDLWFRKMEVEENRKSTKAERTPKKTKAHLEAMGLQTKPEANKWLHLNPRIATLAMEAKSFYGSKDQE